MGTKLSTKEHMGFDVSTGVDSAEKSQNNKISRTKKLSSSSLFEASKEVMIEHDNEIYFLRLTRQNKLILTK